MELFLNIVNAVWHFVFYLGEYVNHTAGKILVGTIIGLPALYIAWIIFFQYFVKLFVYWGTVVYHQAHMDKKFDGTQNEFVYFKFRQKHPRTWMIILLWNFAKKPITLITWDHLDLVGKYDIYFKFFTFEIVRSKALKAFIENGWEIPVEKKDA